MQSPLHSANGVWQVRDLESSTAVPRHFPANRRLHRWYSLAATQRHRVLGLARAERGDPTEPPSIATGPASRPMKSRSTAASRDGVGGGGDKRAIRAITTSRSLAAGD